MFDLCFSNMSSRNRNTESRDTVVGSREAMPMASGDCSGCGTCAGNCPTKAIVIDGGWKVDLGRCIFCMDCAMVCPDGCIGEAPAPDYALTREELIVSADTDIESLEKPLDPSVRRMFKGSVALRELDTGSCNACEVDLNCMSNQFYDMHRF
ncbi:MAG: 4Fe-4S binding protein, partial [Thermoplasmata archaeon]|nr:4Fe-4S binding protein [Thermoplasmata archaeon]